MQLIFWAHSNSATKHLQQNFSHQVIKLLYSFLFEGHNLAREGKTGLEQMNIKKSNCVLDLW